MFNLNNLNDEYFLSIDPEEILEIKKLPTEDKIKCFKYFLSSDCISNVSVISNLYLLINGISSIDEESLEDARVFFNSLEEYVDIKLELREELNEFNTHLLEYYLGIVEGIDVNLDELKSHIPNTYFNIFSLVTVNLISKLMLKYFNKINPDNVKPAFNASKLYNQINNPDSLVLGFLQGLADEVNFNDLKHSGTM